MRKLLLALLLVGVAAFVTVPRLSDGDDLSLRVPAGTDPAEAAETLRARLADAGLSDVNVVRHGSRLALSSVDGGSRHLVQGLVAAYRLQVRPVDGECSSADKPDATDPRAAVELPVRPPATPTCLRLGPSVASNDAVVRAQASGTTVVIRFGDIPLATRSEWAVEVDGEVLAAPRVSTDDGEGVELVIEAHTAPAALALASGIAHPLPAGLVA